MNDNTNTKLAGKKILFMGDSITAATAYDKEWKHEVTGWAGRIGYYYGAEAFNYGIDGASVSDIRGKNTVIAQLERAHNSGSDFNIVVLHGGVNDAWGNPKEDGSYDVADPGKVTEDGCEDFDSKTFAGALEILFRKTLEYYGESAKIGYICNFKFDPAGVASRVGAMGRMEGYHDQALAACKKYGIECLDLYADEKIFNDILNVPEGSVFGDGWCHPNTKGYDALYPVIGEWIVEKLA